MNLIEQINSYAVGDNLACIYRESTLNFKELKEMSDALACYISEVLSRDGSPILVFGHKDPLMLVCFLACVKSGHSYIPVDSGIPEGRIKAIVESSQTSLILNIEFASFKYYEGMLLYKERILDVICKYKGSVPEADLMVKPEETFYIIYTSGSTGMPKGVMVTRANVESFVKWGCKLCIFDKQNIFMNQAPFSFDLSVMDLYLSLASGSTLYIIDKPMVTNLKELFYYLRNSNITTWVSTPSFMEMCLSSEQFNPQLLPALRQTLFCGEVLSIKTVKKLMERFKNLTITNSYGPTEATVAVTALNITHEMVNSGRALPVGAVKDDCKIFISSEGENSIEGGKGEIIIVGDSVAKGYHNNKEITEKSFFLTEIDGRKTRGYRTGDEGYIEKGILYYCGRIDFQVKLNGYRIELEDIENNLSKVSIVENSVVLPVYKQDKILYFLAVVVLNEERTESVFDTSVRIKRELEEYLPQYMIPRKIMIRDSLPMNSNGKINRGLLMEEYL